jgi:hypothetical protein
MPNTANLLRPGLLLGGEMRGFHLATPYHAGKAVVSIVGAHPHQQRGHRER